MRVGVEGVVYVFFQPVKIFNPLHGAIPVGGSAE